MTLPADVGFVSLVGAGPGDPELLTLKALRRLRNADVVAYDRLVNSELLTECRPGADLIYVGKHGNCRNSWTQQAIDDLLVSRAQRGERVVRLKGGDPFVFGRGGEEALTLRAHSVPFEIVPGISSALAAPAYAGIPLTHRRVASSFAVVTGHEDPFKPQSSVDWAALATAVDTLVILMGVGRIREIASELIVAGRPADTPAAAVRMGTSEAQQTLVAPLAELPGALEALGMEAPAAIVIGEVVRLRSDLRWFVHDVTRQAPQSEAPPQPMAVFGD